MAQPFDPPGASKVQASIDGGSNPRWRRDGRELYFVSGDSMLMAVEVRVNPPAVQLGAPQALFRISHPSYDSSPDGSFLTLAPNRDSSPVQIDLVANWASEMRPR